LASLAVQLLLSIEANCAKICQRRFLALAKENKQKDSIN